MLREMFGRLALARMQQAARGGARRRAGRLKVEGLEDRLTPADVGDVLGFATTAAGLSATAGTYANTTKLGDGTTAALDVDLYRFTAAAGSALTALTSLPPTGTPTDTYLRLFDSTGTELAADDNDALTGSSYSRLRYVFPAGGTYFLGVSGAGNAAYNPGVAGSGAAGSTGDYTLSLSMLSTAQFGSVGPTPILGGQVPGAGPVSGRVTAIAPNPTNPSVIYLGSAGGGVWKTTDAGATWAPLTDTQASLAIGALAVARSNPNVIYAGTGEPNNSGDSQPGKGILKSTNGGQTWSLLGAAQFTGKTISQIVVHPTNPNIVYAAVGPFASNGSFGGTGVWKSTDGGLTWANTTAGPLQDTFTGFSDLIMDPSNPQTLYTAIGSAIGGTTNGVYKTINGGFTWSRAGNFPLGSADPRIGRIALAVSPASPQTVYAAVSDSDPTGATFGALYKFFKSADGGRTWANPSTTIPNYPGTQGWYDLSLAVDPTNPNVLYAGGSGPYDPLNPSLITSTDGGVTWTTIETGVSGKDGPHADHHAMAFDALGRLLDGDDGGIWRLDDATPAGLRWNDLNATLSITQFTGIALHPTDPTIAYGGSQDNGTEKYTGSLGWQHIQDGDGGFVRVDQNNPNTVYHTFFYGGNGFLERSDDGGVTWNGVTSGINTTNPALPDEDNPAHFYPPYVIDPNPARQNRLLLGTDRVNETVDQGNNWVELSAPGKNGWTAAGPIDWVAAAASDVNTIYASVGSKIFKTVDHGATWTNVSIAKVSGPFEEVWVDPSSANIVYAVGGAIGGGHVFRSLDGGATWADLTGNGLPDQPTHTIAVEQNGPGLADDVLFVGDDTGVFRSRDQGVTWAKIAGLPNVQVVDLEVNENLQILAAGTHGRGMWELAVGPTPLSADPAITGQVFEDWNGDGLKDPVADTPAAGVTVYLDNNNNGVLDANEPTAVTDPAGQYAFTAQPTGTYTLRVQTAAGVGVTFPATGSYPINLAVGGSVTGQDFGIARANSFYGRVTVDQNRSGAFDATETGLAGRMVFDDVNRNGVLDRRPFSAASGAINLAIPDADPVSGASNTLSIAGVPGVVAGVTVTMDISHPADGELLLDLTSPSGQTITLAANRGGAGGNFSATVFDDAAPVPVVNGVAPFTGRFRPDQLLAALIGTAANGSWTLRVRDTVAGNVGQLNSWSLTVTGTTEPTAVTDANGYYRFDNIGAGSHAIRVVAPTDWTNTYPTGGQFVVSIPNGKFLQNLDFGQTFNMNQMAPMGPEAPANTFTAGDQSAAVVGSDAQGNYVVVWQSAGQDGSGLGVYAQRYNADGTPNGTEFRVSTTIVGDQAAPAVAVSPTGAFVVAWQGPDAGGTGIFAQRYSAAGTKIGGEFPVNTTTAGNQQAPVVAIDPTGNFVVAWESAGQDGSGYGVYAQRYNSTGAKVGGETQANTFTAGDQRAPAVAVDPTGNFVIVWQGAAQEGFPAVPANAGTGIFGQRFTAAGAPSGVEFQVNTTAANNQANPAVAADLNGNFVVAWQSFGQDGSGYGIYAQRYGATGVPTGTEFKVNTYTGSAQTAPAVTADGLGNFVVAWQSNGEDRSGYGVYAQRYTSFTSAASPGPLGREVRLNSTAPGNQTAPALAAAANGNFVAAWTDDGRDGSGTGVFAQRYTLAAADRSPNRINLSNTTIAENAGAGAVVGTLSGADPDGDVPTFSLVPGAVDNAQFQIVGTQLQAVGSFDYEARGSYTVRVRASDPSGLYLDKLFTVTVTNVNEAPTGINLSSQVVKENAGPNALIGLLTAADPDLPVTPQTFTYSLVPGQQDNALFNIFAGTQLRANASLDFEAQNSYTVVVQVRDQGGATFQQSFTIAVVDVNEAPTDAVLAPNTIPENSLPGTVVGTVTGVDPDAGDTLTYRLVPGAADNALFTLAGTTLTANQTFDYEARNQYSVVVRVTDAAGLTLDKTIAVNVTNVNEPPTGLTLSGASITENNAVGAVIGNFTTADPDAADTFTYSIIGGDAAAFGVVNGQLVAKVVFDYETKSSYTITVQSTDSGGSSVTRTFVISVLDAPEPGPLH